MTGQEASMYMDQLGMQREPFLFIIDFEMKRPMVYPLSNLPDEISYELNIPGDSSCQFPALDVDPVSLEAYSVKFNQVIDHLNYGNTYLLNLTCNTPIRTKLNLEEVYQYSKARYKLLLEDKFVVFSPEPFIKISNGRIHSFPMKGTIRSDVPNAKSVILNNEKEIAEHATIVDLIRNDLGMVSSSVRVDKYRYVEEVMTNAGNILQVSSEVSGVLEDDYMQNLGQLIFTLLPAGSISGAPKPKTLEIISEVENRERGYFTGVFGVFDGSDIDSAVMIRFIEKTPQGFIYKSGGGITAKSRLSEEYSEMIDKVYVPY